MESQMMTSRSAGLRYNEQTSPVAKWLGKTFGLSPIKIDYLITGYAGRSAGFLTGKPGIYNPFKSMSREYYFTSGRKIQSFYDLKEKNDQDYYDYKHGLRKFALGERSAILKQRAKLKLIYDLIDTYRDIDPKKQPAREALYRDKILAQIDKLND